MKNLLLFISTCFIFGNSLAQVNIRIDTKLESKLISHYIYGRNNSIASTNPTWVISDKDLVQIRDAGVTFFRESGGNNCSINANKDSITVILVNRSPSVTQNTSVELANWVVARQEAPTYTLKSLSLVKTFVFNCKNALSAGRAKISDNK